MKTEEKYTENQFLRQVARAFVNHVCMKAGGSGVDGSGLGGHTFVFPNRRSMLFFRKYLGEEYGKVFGRPLLAPRQMIVGELFTELSGLTPADPVEMLYMLYRRYVSLSGSSEPFDDFIFWGNVLIEDFDDIDKYMVDAKQLFTNIKDLKDLDGDFSYLSASQREAIGKFWGNFFRGGDAGLSGTKEEFISLWRILGRLYEEIREDLFSCGRGYEGMIYRAVAQKLDERRQEPELSGKERETSEALEALGEVVFIGLNAPNPCEKKLMKYLKERGRGDFYWDFYGEMITDPRNKSSVFTAENVREFPSLYPLEAALRGEDVAGERYIEAIGVPSAVGQTLVAAKILEELEGDPIRTAVVLPDENLLMPMLNAVPGKYEKVNVTMGYPLKATGLASFVDLLAALQRDVREKGGNYYLYGRSVLDILNHEYIQTVAAERARYIKGEIVSKNIIYIPIGDPLLRGGDGPGERIMELLFAPLEQIARRTTSAPLEQCRFIADCQLELLKELEQGLGPLEKNYIYQYALILNKLNDLDIPMRADTFYRLVRQRVNSVHIPFRGEPLQGLQIMGVLETRALDFENLIILSFNEGVYPASDPAQSFIPYNIRKGFGLPAYELRDGVTAYHFYRSLYRARRVYFIYDTRTEGIKGGEESRFIKQLKYHFGAKVISTAARYEHIAPSADPIEVRKDSRIMEIIRRKLFHESYLSASVLNQYISCPLSFYYRKIEGIKDDNEELEESVSDATFGTIFHYCMEKIYQKYENNIVTADILEAEKKNRAGIERYIADGFRKELGIEEPTGENLIIKELIKRYVQVTLENDKREAPFVYTKGEKEYYCHLDGVRFLAKIDRIDRIEGPQGRIVRLADYKTGSVDRSKFPGEDFPVDPLFEPDRDKNRKILFQLLLYALIYCQEEGAEREIVRTVVYPVRTIARDPVISIDISPAKRNEYARRLSGLIEEILDSRVPFQMCQDQENCVYCDYKSICNR